MSSFIDKTGVLDRIKAYYNLKTSSELALFLGVAPTTISSWYSRKTFDIDVLYSKCVGVSFDWLLSGIKQNKEEALVEDKISPSKNGQVNSQVNGQVDNTTDRKPISIGTPFVISDNKPSFLNLPEMDAVPFYDLPVSAGALGALNGWESCEPSGYVKLDAFRGCEGVFPVMGVSMEPVVHSGDLIGIKSIQGISARWDFLQTGVIYLIITHEERMIKYIEEAGDNDYIVCSSPNYKPFRVHKADILQLYRVKAIVRGL